jgi:hypothetical protein
MSRAQKLLASIAGTLTVAALGMGALVALQVALVHAPLFRASTFWDGLVHGVLVPLNSARWVFGAAGVKDFASGWDYEAGFAVGSVGLLVTWQTVLQVVANQQLGRTTPFDKPFLRATIALLVLALVIGLALGGSFTPPLGPVPPLWAVIPGWLRQGGMAMGGLLIGLSGALACISAVFDSRR